LSGLQGWAARRPQADVDIDRDSWRPPISTPDPGDGSAEGWADRQPTTVLQWAGGRWSRRADAAIEEMPVALVYNGISHAVMLATPNNLGDFALGFSLSEGILASPGELYDWEPVGTAQGIELRLSIASARFAALQSRRRSLAGRTGCGLCGVESLSALARPTVPVAHTCRTRPMTIAHALADLPAHQRLFRDTGGGHAAAWIGAEGDIRLVREDVGRHNALDKLIGALSWPRTDDRFQPHEGFAIGPSGAGSEMAQKSMPAGIGLLVAVSAPTASAIRLADEAGMTLVGFARGSRMLVYTHPEPLLDPS
jgi:FdhD protein